MASGLGVAKEYAARDEAGIAKRGAAQDHPAYEREAKVNKVPCG